MRINHNIPALKTINQLEHVNKKTADAMERLSSGLRINNAADDAAGMAISNKMDAQIRGLQQANRNTMDGISMIQTAEGALNEVHAILQRARELTVQAANGTNSEEDVEQIQQEINQLVSEINRIGEQTEFNTKPLLKGEELAGVGGDGFKIPTGFTPGAPDTAEIEIPVLDDKKLMDLVGKGFTVDGVTIEFYDGRDKTYSGSAEGIDVSKCLGGNPTIEAELAKEIGKVLTNNIDINKIKVTANNNKIELEIIDATVKPEWIIIKDGGTVNTSATLQVGANKGQTMDLDLGDMRAGALGLTGKPGQPGFSTENNVTDGKTNDYTSAAISVVGQANAQNALVIIDKAINKVSTQRGIFGASQNRLEHTVNNLGVSEENLTASLSRIQDADIAAEMATFTQQNVLSQAATAMLAQANQRPQQVLQLLQR